MKLIDLWKGWEKFSFYYFSELSYHFMIRKNSSRYLSRYK